MRKSQEGFIEGLGILFVLLLVFTFFFLIFFVRFHASQSEVSGIVYNTEANHLVNGNTTFSVRAGIDTYVGSQNQSNFCLPPHSPYTALVEKAANNKNIKVDITANKYFAIQSPFTCRANVIVKEIK